MMEAGHGPHKDQSQRPLRPLLPANLEPARSTSPLPAKKPRTSGACSACRTRKTRCGAERPRCGECVTRDTQCEYLPTQRQFTNAQYETLYNKCNAQEEILKKLMSLPDNEALDMLNRLRAGGAPQHAIVPASLSNDRVSDATAPVSGSNYRQSKRKIDSYNRGAAELTERLRRSMSPDDERRSTMPRLNHINPSLNRTNRGLLPPTETSIEFQLTALHRNAYPSLVPLDIASLDLGLLGISPLTSFNRDKSLPQTNIHHDSPLSHSKQIFSRSPFISNVIDPIDISTGALPAHYADARLERIRIQYWTEIPIQDDLAARIINIYLVNETSWWGDFDVDLFLDDLINFRTRFCSRLLVHALLAWSSKIYSYFEPATYSLCQPFLHEATNLYDTVENTNSLTTIPALSLMYRVWSVLGNNDIGLKLVKENARIAERLQLYNVVAMDSAGLLDLTDEDTRYAAGACAWGSYNLQTTVNTFYRTGIFIKFPPTLPIPGDSSTDSSIRRSLPPYQSGVYTAVCKFWRTVSEMIYRYSIGEVSMELAETVFHKLLLWADGLQKDVRREENTPDRVVTLHIWFHGIILDLFRPFADLRPQPKLTTFDEQFGTPLKIVEASVKQLKHLIYTYRATSVSANYSVLWHSGMLHLMNHLLHHGADKEAHFYFLLCMRGWQRLARIYPLLGEVAQGVATMAVNYGAIVPEDAFGLMREIRSDSKQIQDWKGEYPVDLYQRDQGVSADEARNFHNEFESMEEGWGGMETDVPEGWKGDSAALLTTLVEDEYIPETVE